MHEKLTHCINFAHMFPEYIRSFQTLLGFALYFVSSIVVAVTIYSISTWTRIPCWDSHCEGLSRLSLPALSFNSPRFASFNLTWDAEAASNELCSTFIQLSGFPEDTDIPGLSDAIGIDAKVFWENHLKDLNRIPRFRNIGIREQMALRQLCPKLCTVVNVWTNSLFLPKQHWMTGSDSPFQDTTQTMNEEYEIDVLMTVADFGHKKLWMIMESVDDRGIHRLLLIAACPRHAILARSSKFQQGQNDCFADPDRKSELTPTSTSLVQNNNYERISNAIWTELGRENKRRVNLVQIESHPESCKRNVAMSWSLRLPTCHVQRSLCLTFALGQYKHAQQSPHGVFGDARLGPDVWS